MGKVMVTVRLMPVGIEVDLIDLTNKASAIIKKTAEGEVGVKEVPIAFGLKALHLTFIIDESKGGTEPIEKELSSLAGVSGVDVVNVSLI